MNAWQQSRIALALLAEDPIGLGGLRLRARSGPVRDQFLSDLPGPLTRVHPAMTAADLHGGIDLSATLQTGSLHKEGGILRSSTELLLLVMAERADPALTAQLAQHLDTGMHGGLIALDEGVGEEALAQALSDRLAFHLDFEDSAYADMEAPSPAPSDASDQAPVSLREASEALTHLAATLGITSLRAPSFALRAARAHARWNGRSGVTPLDIEIAVSLVYAPRATRLPTAEQEDQPAPQQPPETAQGETSTQAAELSQDMLLDAVQATLPDGVLTGLHQRDRSKAKGSGSGQRRIGNRRGRPLPPRDRQARRHERIDLLATLRAAIPWQTLRKRETPNRPSAVVYPADLRARRYQERSDRLLVFAVDASGSAALARLGEAKGAVELLLAEAYARRDHVSLISFRGTEADVLLPPTRSLVQTKRRLAKLPGGGGTPLAAGLKAGLETAMTARRKGMMPTLVVLTDGRSNIALDGSADRKAAASDVNAMARSLAAYGISGLVIDTGKRPSPDLAKMAGLFDARYVPMPRADARMLSQTVSAQLDA